MAFLLHLISKEAHAELTNLKTIRNSFAHDLTIRDFDSTSVKDRVKSLRLIDKYLSEDSGAAGSTVMHFGHPLKTPFLFIGSFNKNKNIPRYRYMLTVQMFLAAFARVFVGQRTPPVI